MSANPTGSASNPLAQLAALAQDALATDVTPILQQLDTGRLLAQAVGEYFARPLELRPTLDRVRAKLARRLYAPETEADVSALYDLLTDALAKLEVSSAPVVTVVDMDVLAEYGPGANLYEIIANLKQQRDHWQKRSDDYRDERDEALAAAQSQDNGDWVLISPRSAWHRICAAADAVGGGMYPGPTQVADAIERLASEHPHVAGGHLLTRETWAKICAAVARDEGHNPKEVAQRVHDLAQWHDEDRLAWAKIRTAIGIIPDNADSMTVANHVAGVVESWHYFLAKDPNQEIPALAVDFNPDYPALCSRLDHMHTPEKGCFGPLAPVVHQLGSVQPVATSGTIEPSKPDAWNRTEMAGEMARVQRNLDLAKDYLRRNSLLGDSEQRQLVEDCQQTLDVLRRADSVIRACQVDIAAATKSSDTWFAAANATAKQRDEARAELETARHSVKAVNAQRTTLCNKVEELKAELKHLRSHLPEVWQTRPPSPGVEHYEETLRNLPSTEARFAWLRDSLPKHVTALESSVPVWLIEEVVEELGAYRDGDIRDAQAEEIKRVRFHAFRGGWDARAPGREVDYSEALADYLLQLDRRGLE